MTKLDDVDFNKWLAGYYNKIAAPPKAPKKSMAKRGRPKKDSIITGFPSISVTVVANGYLVNITGSGGPADIFVFDNLDKLHEWMKDNLCPKFKNQEFIKAL